jgi:4a-hydroxytetrahydrobiopterin dehydratase
MQFCAQKFTKRNRKEELMMTTFPDEAVREWLTVNLPKWQLQKSFLLRVYKTPSWRVTLLVANAIGFLAEAADHHPELILNYPSVEIHLKTHSAGGITALDYALARKIEETVLWLPGTEDALEDDLNGPAGKWVEPT